MTGVPAGMLAGWSRRGTRSTSRPSEPRPLADDRVRPWWDVVETWAGVAVVAVCCAYVLAQLRPGLLILDTTAAGGDTGAHVWFPAFLRDHLLPWRLTGWAPDFYAGFPAGQFYFPFPALLIVALDLVLPFNVAFKLVTALGAVALPAAAYVFGRGIRAPRPAPALFAVAATVFLFFKDGGDSIMKFDHHIMGGTLTSTLAGEYSFTIALALALCFLGTLARALEVRPKPTRVNLWLPALLLAATATSHLVVAVFAVYGAAVLWLVRRPLRSFTRAAAILVVGGLLTAVWSLPLAASLGYTTDMRYEPVGTGYTDPWLLGRLGIRLPAWFDWLFISEMWFLFPLAMIAIGAGIAYRRRADARRRRHPARGRVGVLRVGAAARRVREGAGVEPAPVAVLVRDALPARGTGCRRGRAVGGHAGGVGRVRARARRSRRHSRSGTTAREKPETRARSRRETTRGDEEQEAAGEAAAAGSPAPR